MIDNYSLVNYHCVDVTEEESVQELIMQIDNMVQYDEYKMPNDKQFMDNQEDYEQQQF